MTAPVLPSQPSIAPEKIRGGIALIEAAISNMAATKTALGYNEMDMKNLARFVFANWKYVDAESASLKARIQELESNEKAYEAALGQRTYNEVATHIEELEGALREIEQRANESGTGEIGLLDTIHAVYRLATTALEAKPAGGTGV